MKPITAWAVKNKKGKILRETISSTKSWAIQCFTDYLDGHMHHGLSWPQSKKEGYRAVKVEIREVEK